MLRSVIVIGNLGANPTFARSRQVRTWRISRWRRPRGSRIATAISKSGPNGTAWLGSGNLLTPARSFSAKAAKCNIEDSDEGLEFESQSLSLDGASIDVQLVLTGNTPGLGDGLLVCRHTERLATFEAVVILKADSQLAASVRFQPCHLAIPPSIPAVDRVVSRVV